MRLSKAKANSWSKFGALYRARKVPLSISEAFLKKRNDFKKRCERSSWMQARLVLHREALSRRKTGIKPLLVVAFYTVLTVDKTSVLK
jgi:hypothetical protein